MNQSLKGQLLVSGGGLFDPNFRHTVVLIGEHDEEGAVGVVLNRPLDVTVEESVPPLAGLVGAGEMLYEGGPVRPHEPVLVVDVAHPELVDVLVFGSIGFLTDEVSADVRAGIHRARVYAGHAGWGPGQLDAEMEHGSWIVATPEASDVFTDDPETLWRRVLERQGPEYRALSRMPFDPSMN